MTDFERHYERQQIDEDEYERHIEELASELATMAHERGKELRAERVRHGLPVSDGTIGSSINWYAMIKDAMRECIPKEDLYGE